MRILIFHPCFLPPKDYGGVERVVLWLAKGLTQLGVSVTVGALPGSQLPDGVELLPVDPKKSSAEDLIGQIPAGTDLVHFMAPPGASALSRMPCPSLLTVHGNGKPGEEFPPETVFLSQDHARRHGRTAFVYNGIDPDELLFSGAPSERYLFLSKTSWRVKNVRGAAKLCRQAGVRLDVAGGHRPWMTRAQVLLSGGRWWGPVHASRKAEILAHSRALVFPVRWDEPFGLVMVEAMMSGTPVLASRRGSVPEIVSAETGRVLPEPLDPASEEIWIEELRSGVSDLKRTRCREWAIEKFHYMKMTESYSAIYERLIRAQTLE